MADASKFSQLRDADWLDAKSVRFWALMLLLVDLFPIVFRLLTGDGLIDRNGMPFGGDYISFFAASRLALSGHAADAWRPELHHVAETAVFSRDLGYWAFFYPPPYLLLCLPLGLVSYGWSTVIALGTTTGLMLATVRTWLARMMAGVNAGDARAIWLPLIAFPGIWMNIACGQNAALTTAIMAGGCLLLQRAPVASGLVFGLLVIKPQLALALPFLLAASGRWKTFFAAGVSAFTLCLVAWLVFGTESYAAFFANSALARATLDQGFVDAAKMQSLFGALKTLGLSNVAAYAAQILLAGIVLARAGWIAVRLRPDAHAFGALLVSASLLVSPFLLDYDLLMIVLPLGWLILTGVREGFKPWEKMLCIWIFLLPAVARGLAEMAHLPLGALSVCLLFWLVQGRIAKTADTNMSAV
ncbi:glycosyltransferase family 87 protein [Asticcacaulis sp. 201]|uniref:glycosyltransferase family 87 protein n=1 Tax=Asticcacaulis sp. 201 TaxID=3028787 RepID=UPI002916C216|nr:glycosyltransferase family 87 protein [Asticcacaulis sp. 201]MDV6331758.1 glycosyltransferase family 87 protein [Asticcacaulis sp. 201]